MKKILAVFVAAVVGVTSTFAISSKAFAEAAENDAAMAQEEFISEANEYVEVTDDGFIELELPDELIDELTPEEYEQMMAGISAINEAVESGELEVTPNGTIYETEDDELVVQGGNVDKLTWHWWGVRRYASHNNANYMANQCAKYAEGFGAFSYSAGLVALLGSKLSKTASIILGFISGCAGLTGLYFSGLGRNIGYYNGSSGVVIDITWILVYKVKSQ